MKWIKASERLPEEQNGNVVLRYTDTDKIFVFNLAENIKVKIDFDGYHYKKDKVEWLDQSPDPTPSSAEVEKKEGLNMNGYKTPKDCPSGFYCNHPKCYCSLSEMERTELVSRSVEVYRKALEGIINEPGEWNVYKQIARKAIGEVDYPGMTGTIHATKVGQGEQVKGEELDFEEVPVFSLKQVENLVLEFGNMVSAAKGKGFDMPNDSAEFVHEKYKILTSF